MMANNFIKETQLKLAYFLIYFIKLQNWIQKNYNLKKTKVEEDTGTVIKTRMENKLKTMM